MYIKKICVNNINGDIMNNDYNQKIDCCVTDCVHCKNGCQCDLDRIQVVKDIRNENTMYNTICQSYEEEK